ncbi:tRNA (adenosine(37)-N6)-threonylcarbamoyltransferase complex dimerization subunit type 1 TsaB [Roseimarinus sediminis]|uniref:tRNA (adenosine(37)-N6)-threonylcarbamoyltransferase complex dimerization subunit type 1 TsaB n=1 Tax=Roseimarinus sediminis TaxID=1610899 RepID=UPI003D1CDBB8
MSGILCLESSTEICSVALADKGKLLALKEDRSGMNHSRLLTVFIDEILSEQNLSVSALDAVAVSGGPGSYTGLRIGVSAAKGLCFGAGLPLIAISPLEAMAHEVRINSHQYGIELNESDLLVPMIDARRMEVYCMVSDVNGKPVQEVQALVIDEEALKQWPQQRLLYFGNGAEKCQPVLRGENYHYVDGVVASAKHMTALAEKKFLAADFVDVAYYEPFYLKNFIATIPRKNVLGR